MYYLLCALCVIGFMSAIERMTCCNKCKTNSKNQYYKLILEEEENVLKELLTERAKGHLTAKIKDKLGGSKWEECFDAAVELIEKDPAPPIEVDSKVRKHKVFKPC